MKTKRRKRRKPLTFLQIDDLRHDILKCVHAALDPDDAEEWLTEYLEPLVQERAEVEIENVNIAGPEAQLEYLLKGYNGPQFEKIFKDLRRELHTNPAQKPDPARPVRGHGRAVATPAARSRA